MFLLRKMIERVNIVTPQKSKRGERLGSNVLDEKIKGITTIVDTNK